MYRLIVEVLTTFLTLFTTFLSLVKFDSLAGGGGISDMTCDIRLITESFRSLRKTVLSRSIIHRTSAWGRSPPLQDPLLEVQCLSGIEVRTELFEKIAIEV